MRVHLTGMWWSALVCTFMDLYNAMPGARADYRGSGLMKQPLWKWQLLFTLWIPSCVTCHLISLPLFKAPQASKSKVFNARRPQIMYSALHSWTECFPFGQRGNSYLYKGIKAKNISLCLFFLSLQERRMFFHKRLLLEMHHTWEFILCHWVNGSSVNIWFPLLTFI